MADVDLRKAVKSVRNYVSEFSDVLGNNLEDLKIEETELSEDDKYWSITVSFNRAVDPKKHKIYVSDPLGSNSPFYSVKN